MSEIVITHPRTGYRFRLVASHTSCVEIDSIGIPKGHDCEGCGTKRGQAPA